MPAFAIPLGLKIGAGLLGAGYVGNELKKAGQRREIDKIVRDLSLIHI